MKKTTRIEASNIAANQTDQTLMLTGLPEDVLYLIMSYLDIPSLGIICRTCKYLRELACADCTWLRHSRRHHLIKDGFIGRRLCQSLKEKCRIAQNWSDSKYKEVTLIRNPVRLLPWLQHTERELLVSIKNCIRLYQVQPDGHVRDRHRITLHGPKQDVCRFVNKNGLTVAGSRDGSICGWETASGCQLFQYDLHTSDAQCVDIVDDLVISGSRDATVKITTMQPDVDHNRIRRSRDVGARVWSLSVSPQKSVFATGSSGCNGIPPLTIWDLHSGEVRSQLGSDHKQGAGILDMKFESPHTLLTCGYDTYLRLWDMRTNTCVSKWEEPFDSSVYCLASDSNNMVVTGTARHGMTRLWDKRSTTHLQVYFTGQRSSPVYSLGFDSRRMYVALDLSLNLIDFSVSRSASILHFTS